MNNPNNLRDTITKLKEILDITPYEEGYGELSTISRGEDSAFTHILSDNENWESIKSVIDEYFSSIDSRPNDDVCAMLQSIICHIKDSDTIVSILEDCWVCKLHQSIVDDVKDELPSLYKRQLIHEDAIEWLHDNHPEVYEEFYERVDGERYSNNIE